MKEEVLLSPRVFLEGRLGGWRAVAEAHGRRELLLVVGGQRADLARRLPGRGAGTGRMTLRTSKPRS